MTPDELELALDKLIEGFGVVEKTIAGVQGCYLPRLYQAETFVAERLLSLVRTPVEVLPQAEKVIDDIEKEQGVAYAPLQRQAVCLAAQGGILLLTGGPGTGKTTSLRGIVALYERMGLDVALLAPTGRAAKRLGEVTGREAQTIHHAVDRGELPPLENSGSGDLFFLRRRAPDRLVQTVVELCRDRLPKNMGIPAEQIQVLSPTRKGPCGTAALNRALQAALNPPAPGKRRSAVSARSSGAT